MEGDGASSFWFSGVVLVDSHIFGVLSHGELFCAERRRNNNDGCRSVCCVMKKADDAHSQCGNDDVMTSCT